MALLRPQLAAIQQQRAVGPPAGTAACLAPATRELYALLEARSALERVDEAAVQEEISQIMAAVEADVVRYPAAGRALPPVAAVPGAAPGSGGRVVAACSVDSDAPIADAELDGVPASPGASDGNSMSADAALATSEAVVGATAACTAETQRRDTAEAEECAKLAEQYAAAAAEDDGGCGGDDWDGGDDGGGWDAGGDDGSDNEGAGAGAEGEGGDEGGAGGEALLGAGSALEDMLGAGGLSGLLGLGGSAGRGAGWAGSSYWRHQRAPPGGGAAKRAGDGKVTRKSSKR